MGLFGRKKKEAGVVEEAQDDNQLNLAYGNDDDDCSTEGDSLPPPPPGGGSTKQNVSLNDSHTVEDSPSADEANDVGVSMLSDPDSSMDEKNKDQDPSKRKKMLLIFASIATFCILLGLAIKLGLDSKQLKKSSANASELDGTDAGAANNDGSFDSPIDGGDNEEDIFTTSDTIPTVVEDIPEVIVDTTVIEPVDTTPISTVDEITQAPTIDSSVAVTDAVSSDVTGGATGRSTTPSTGTASDFVTDSGTGDDDLTDDFAVTECVVDEIFASSGCNNGVTSASISMCIADETSDQFWEWVETPQAYAPFQERDWGYVRNGLDREISGLPEGNYVLGLYSNGDADMEEYPLIASTEFTILCATN
jgi:hypothetical protein